MRNCHKAPIGWKQAATCEISKTSFQKNCQYIQPARYKRSGLSSLIHAIAVVRFHFVSRTLKGAIAHLHSFEAHVHTFCSRQLAVTSLPDVRKRIITDRVHIIVIPRLRRLPRKRTTKPSIINNIVIRVRVPISRVRTIRRSST